MKGGIRQLRVCPLCGEAYGSLPAISRTDNETQICPDCGSRQALEALGVSEVEREKIISIINRGRRTST